MDVYLHGSRTIWRNFKHMFSNNHSYDSLYKALFVNDELCDLETPRRITPPNLPDALQQTELNDFSKMYANGDEMIEDFFYHIYGLLVKDLCLNIVNITFVRKNSTQHFMIYVEDKDNETILVTSSSLIWNTIREKQ
jgi:hypothetical protein